MKRYSYRQSNWHKNTVLRPYTMRVIISSNVSVRNVDPYHDIMKAKGIIERLRFDLEWHLLKAEVGLPANT